MANNYNLFLDDSPRRIPSKLTWIKLPDVEWTIVRTYEEFVHVIMSKGLPKILSYDHDLTDEHYKEYFRVKATGFKEPIGYSHFKIRSGWHCAQWLAKYCMDNKKSLPAYYVHTLNEPGKANIITTMENARRELTDPAKWSTFD